MTTTTVTDDQVVTAAAFFGWLGIDDALESNLGWLTLWTLQDKQSRQFDNTDEAAEWAVKRDAEGCDVFFHTCLMRSGIKPGKRGAAADATALPGLWLDIDCQSPHRKGNANDHLPETFDQAMSIVDRIGLPPSVVVDSGFGLHTYWLLTEPLAIDDDNRDDISALTKRWWATASAAAAEINPNWKIDPAHDLARVLRVPGCHNRKAANHETR